MNYLLLVILVITGIASCTSPNTEKKNIASTSNHSPMLVHEVDLQASELHFYIKDKTGKRLGNLGALKSMLEEEGQELSFGVNAGMFNPQHEPVGLYIENGQLLSDLDTQQTGYGNFYLQPNGVFWIDKHQQAGIVTTESFVYNQDLLYATQSGPMLIIDSTIHPIFNPTSSNLNIRNGVGLLPNGKLLFVMSKKKVTFYEMASFFLDAGCKNALYLDGVVSKTYLPNKNWKNLEGNLGSLIGEIKR